MDNNAEAARCQLIDVLFARVLNVSLETFCLHINCYDPSIAPVYLRRANLPYPGDMCQIRRIIGSWARESWVFNNMAYKHSMVPGVTGEGGIPPLGPCPRRGLAYCEAATATRLENIVSSPSPSPHAQTHAHTGHAPHTHKSPPPPAPACLISHLCPSSTHSSHHDEDDVYRDLDGACSLWGRGVIGVGSRQAAALLA